MGDPPRGGSLPPSNESEDVHTLINPAYSGSVTGSEGVRFSSSRQEMVEMGIESNIPAETPSMKTIKYCVIALFLLIGILFAYNIYHFTMWISERESTSEGEEMIVSDLEAILDITALSAPGNMTEEITDEFTTSTSPTDSPPPSTTITTESTTTSTEILPTTLSLREQMREAYWNFTERFNRSYSEIGLDNYVANSEIFLENYPSLGETQFADLSEEQLRKLVNAERDPKKGATDKRCDIHTRSDGNTNIEGSSLYGASERVPSRVDLRRRGIIGAVRNQGTSCNAGYAFAVTSLLESKIDTNGSRLSVQMLLADDYNHHCEGGETFRAMESVQHSGVVKESDFPFDVTQHWHEVDENATRYDYAHPCLIASSHRDAYRYKDPHNYWSHITVEASDVPASTYIRQFLAKVGTVVVEVPVDRSFFFYKSGPYIPNCDSIVGYQPALVIGYGMKNGVNVWILRNSFGSDWGKDGDFEMARDANCGAFDYAFSFYNAA